MRLVSGKKKGREREREGQWKGEKKEEEYVPHDRTFHCHLENSHFPDVSLILGVQSQASDMRREKLVSRKNPGIKTARRASFAGLESIRTILEDRKDI